MERRKDYLDNQISAIGAVLRKLFEKIRRRGSAGHTNETQSFFAENIATDKHPFLINDLLQQEETELGNRLVNEFGYSVDEIKLLADVLYELKDDADANNRMPLLRKALHLYEYYQSHQQKISDFTVYTRIAELKTLLEQ